MTDPSPQPADAHPDANVQPRPVLWREARIRERHIPTTHTLDQVRAWRGSCSGGPAPRFVTGTPPGLVLGGWVVQSAVRRRGHPEELKPSIARFEPSDTWWRASVEGRERAATAPCPGVPPAERPRLSRPGTEAGESTWRCMRGLAWAGALHPLVGLLLRSVAWGTQQGSRAERSTVGLV